MEHNIGFKQRMSGCLSLHRQEEELEDYGCVTVHETFEGILRDGEFHSPDDVLVVWELGIIGRTNIDAAFLNVARGGGQGIYSIKDKRLYRAALPYAQDRADAMDAIKGVEYKARSEASKGKAGAQRKMTTEDAERARDLLGDKVHIDDVAAKFKVGPSTVRRAIERLPIEANRKKK